MSLSMNRGCDKNYFPWSEAQTAQTTGLPYISPRGSLMSSNRTSLALFISVAKWITRSNTSTALSA